jgi:formylglycine-generating enzyme required for sulfatase activity
LETITLETLTLDFGRGGKMELVLIPAGEFIMGSPESEEIRGPFNEEGPQHRVRISKPFYLGKYEVTQAQWKAVMGGDPSSFKGDSKLPVESVFWRDCVAFCQEISQKSGKKIRLPTEAEWEYACRAGSTTAYSFGDSPDGLGQYAWYDENSDEQTHPVGQKRPNPWGLYDMHGNVWEWCSDWYGEDYYGQSPATDPLGPTSGEYRVYRGGSWYFCGDWGCRSAVRQGCAYGHANSGFRVAAGTP